MYVIRCMCILYDAYLYVYLMIVKIDVRVYIYKYMSKEWVYLSMWIMYYILSIQHSAVIKIMIEKYSKTCENGTCLLQNPDLNGKITWPRQKNLIRTCNKEPIEKDEILPIMEFFSAHLRFHLSRIYCILTDVFEIIP